MCITRMAYRDCTRPVMEDDEQYVRGLKEGIDMGLVRGIEKGLEKGAEIKSQMVRRKLYRLGFEDQFIKEILGEL